MGQAETYRLDAFLQAIDERRWLRHGLFWLVVTVLMTWYLRYGCHKTDDLVQGFTYALLLLAPHTLATYALLYGVLPALERGTGRQDRFGLLLFGWLLLSMFLKFGFRYLILIAAQHGWHYVLLDDDRRIFPSGAMMPQLGIAGAAAFLHLHRRWRHKQLDNARLAQENYQAELQLLKAQVHPHFLFNTLNNLYALTLERSDQAPEVVARLTGLLRFVMEQDDAPLVKLPDEVGLLRNYLSLQQLRYGPRLSLSFAADNIPATGQIAPLLLLPLVENAFKHGAAEQLGPTRIGIKMAVEGPRFTCVITNTKSTATPAASGSCGIGLQNVRQRLALFYPKRHHFDVEASDDHFTVRLALALGASPDYALQP
ncbi:sensor histidine kinase [Hymenobacter jejuensis]|nr:histidine kinase [Hymenobacter jejuensis]